MRESELQLNIIRLIQNGSFHSVIQGKHEIDHIISQDNNPNYIPNLSIDYMLRHRYVDGAQKVLKAIDGELKIINGEIIKNISLDKNERLLPDFIIVNEENNKIVLMELKGNKQTEREALTELMAYSQEIKNQLPFLTNYDLYYVVISTDFNTLLDHSIGGLLLGSNYNLLCLKPQMDSDELTISIHIPESWTDLRIAQIPPEAISSLSITLYPKLDSNEIEDVDCEIILENAIDVLTYETNRNNAHGFCIGWKSVKTNVYILTVYELNPYELNKYFLKERNDLNLENPLFKHISNDVSETACYETLFGLAQSTFDYLKLYFDPQWESFSDWYSDQTYLTNQSIPYMMGYWGVINDFIRFYYMHPGVRAYMPEFTRNHITYKYPLVGMQFLSYLFGTNLFKDGLFTLKDIFKFGQTMSLCLRYANAVSKGEQDGRSYYTARFHWISYQLLPAIREVAERVRLLQNKEEIFGRFIFSYEYPEETISTIEKFRLWFEETLLGDSNVLAQQVFDVGFNNGYIIDLELYHYVNKSTDEDIQFDVKQVLSFFICYLQPIMEDEESLSAIQTDDFCINNLSIEDVFQNQDFYLDLINKYHFSTIFDFKDEFLKLNVSPLDWSWLKTQTNKIRFSTNQRVAIDINNSGQVSIVRVPENEFTPEIVDYDTDVLVRTAINSHLIVYIVRKWNDLSEGNGLQ